jgi:uncharacterized protein (TIGR02996 family)
MSADRLALLDAMRDDPDDAILRLVYADWLEENGQPERAEFIRLRTERLTLKGDNPRAKVLERQSQALWRTHKSRWAAGMPNPIANRLFTAGLLTRLETNAGHS